MRERVDWLAYNTHKDSYETTQKPHDLPYAIRNLHTNYDHMSIGCAQAYTFAFDGIKYAGCAHKYVWVRIWCAFVGGII